MAQYFKDAYPPLIGGETQQIDSDRHPNQVTEMLNMLPDAVSGVRRRGGFRHLADMQFSSQPYMQHVTVRERPYLLFVEPGSFGRVTIYDIEGGNVAFTGVHDYLKGSGPWDLDYVVHDDELYLLNRSKVVGGTLRAPVGLDPKLNGYAVCVAGNFSTEFTLGLNIGGVTTSVTYKTPDSGADKAQPAYIMQQLVDAANSDATIGAAAGFTWTRVGGFAHVSGTTEFSVVTSTANIYLRVSNSANVKDTSELAAKLPATADGMIIRTGVGDASAYWRWDAADQQWAETMAYGHDLEFTNLPLRLVPDGGTWSIQDIPQKGRMAGNLENNPDPSFAGREITGIGSFQGRLVFLAGDSVSMSATDDVGQWYRKSVTTLADTDPIDVQGTTATGVYYRYAIPLDGDLVLFSATQQSTISGRTVVTNKTVSLAPSGLLPLLINIKPVYTGRGLLVASPTAPGWCSIWELQGGEFRDSAYMQYNTTLHLPTYIKDDLYALTAGQTGKYAAAVQGDCSLRILTSIQHLGEVVQQSWHTWRYVADTRPVNIVQAQFHNEVLYMLIEQGNQYRLVKWADEYQGRVDWDIQVHLDEPREVQFTGNTLYAPVSAYSSMTNGAFLVKRVHPTTQEVTWDSYDHTEFSWRVVGGQYVASTDKLQNAVKVLFGWRYYSSLQPSPPMVTVGDAKSSSDRPQLHRVLLRCADTGTVVAEFSDRARNEARGAIVPALYTVDFRDEYIRARSGVMQFPLRTEMHSTVMTFKTADTYDMRILGIEYGYRPNRRYARAPRREA